MITLTFDEDTLSSRGLSLAEKLLSAKECQGMSVPKLAKMLGITERRIFQLRATERISEEKISDDAMSESENFSDEVLRLFNDNGVNPSKFKGIDADELFSRLKAYSFQLEFDLSRLHLSSRELYDILNNN